MTLLLAAMCVLVGSGLAGAALSRRRSLALGVAAAGALVAAVLGGAGALGALFRPAQTWSLPVSLPGSVGALRLDALSAWFVLVTLGVGAMAATYGRRYLLLEHADRPVGGQALFLNLQLVSLLLVFLAGDAVLFLLGWEAMTLCSFLLITHEHERAEVRAAGVLYLVLTHIGTACLLGFFTWLGALRGSLVFGAGGAALPAAAANGLWALALAGFGIKAGIWPAHIWLPSAHPVAPTHVSAVLSGLVIKSGIYGLLRTILVLGVAPSWVGYALLGAGISSGILGVLNALAQHELKRLLAYHSIENIGIILLGIGAGVLGLAEGRPAVAALGFAGALLHVTNHALFKSLLFLGAGAVLRTVGHLSIDRMGGLLGRMPWTGVTFLVGAVAISGLPPLNGFASELLVYLGLVDTAFLGVEVGAVSIFAAASLALIGGLAAACFAKAFAAVFLGAPRAPVTGGEVPAGMRLPMVALAAACAAIGLGLPWVLPLLAAPVALLAPGADQGLLASGAATARAVTLTALWFVGISAALFGGRALLLRSRRQSAAPTWAGGYASPSPRMQYTSASFAAPLVHVFRGLLLPVRHLRGMEGPFPAAAAIDEHAPDAAERFAYRPVLDLAGRALALGRRLQSSRVHAYVLAVFATLLVLLLWRVAQ